MAEDQPRAKRATKKPAWLLDNVDPSSAEADGEAKSQRQHQKRIPHNETGQKAAAKQEHAERQQRPDAPRRMCLNPGCKNPFDSPQWRRGPLGPGTLCNACGTRYARIEAKKRGEKKGGSKLRPQDVAEWQAFEQQLQWPPDMRQAWAEHAAHSARMASQGQQKQQQLTGRAGQQQQQHYEDEYECEDEHAQLGLQEHDELLCQEGMPDDDSPGKTETAKAAAVAVAAAEQAARQAARQAYANAAISSSSWQLPSRIRQQQQQQQQPVSSQQDQAGNDICHDSYLFEANIAARIAALRQRRRFDNEDGSDSQEAAACSYQEPINCTSCGNSRRPDPKGGTGRPGDQFLHLLAVGEAMIKTEGVAPQDRREAWAEYVEKQLPSEQQKPISSRPADSSVGIKRTLLDSDAAELQGTGIEQQAKLPAPSKHRFERLVAEAECAVRARSASPLLRPVTPQDFTAAAASAARPATAAADGLDAAPSTAAAAGPGSAAGSAACLAERSPVPLSRLGDADRQSQQQQPGALPLLVLPAAATTASGSASTAAGARASAGGPLVAASASGPVDSPSRQVQLAHGEAGHGRASASGRSPPSTDNGTASTADKEQQAMRGSPDSKLLLADELLSPGTISMPPALQQQQQQHSLQDTSNAPTPHRRQQQRQYLPECKQLAQPLQQQKSSQSELQSQVRNKQHQTQQEHSLPKQQKQQLQQQDLVLHMLGGLVIAALGLQAEPKQGESKDPSAERARLQKLLADPVTVRLLGACLADPVAAAWLKDFLGKVGVEGEMLQQKLLHLASQGQVSKQPGATLARSQHLQEGTHEPEQDQGQPPPQPDIPHDEAVDVTDAAAASEQPREHLLESICPKLEQQQGYEPSKAADRVSNTAGVYHNKRLRTAEHPASQHVAAANASA